jgi:2-polyprenyl-3-methyl-5-hydroxy-6-metoxy-1,4-benzoquinol methylase
VESDAQRFEREQAFHDARYEEDESPANARFYGVTTGVGSFFQTRVDRIKPGQRVLEIGCGNHASCWPLAERGVDVVAIDISPVAIREMKELAAERGLSNHLSFEEMNAETLTFDPGTFDVVIGNSILHHLNIEQALSGIDSVLADGGQGIFREPLGHNPVVNAYRRFTPSLRTVDEHPLRTEDLELIERRFPASTQEFYNLVDLLALGAMKTPYFERIRDALAKVDRWLFAHVPALRRFGWMVGIEIRKSTAASSSRP